MKDDREYNDALQRQANRNVDNARKHQEKIEQLSNPVIENSPKDDEGLSFTSENKETKKEKKKISFKLPSLPTFHSKIKIPKVKEPVIEEPTIKHKKTKQKRPKGNKFVFGLAVFVSLIVFIGVIGVCGGVAFAFKLCEDKPELHVENLVSPDSSAIYDNEGNKIMEVGMYLRENVDYDELPNCLVDAFLASEDSRFYEHLGFDIPRFTKALMSYVAQGGEISSGGSTLTMQLISQKFTGVE